MGHRLVHRQVQRRHTVATAGSCEGLRVCPRLREGLTVPDITPAHDGGAGRSHRLVHCQVQRHNAVTAVCRLESLRVGARLRVGLTVPDITPAHGGGDGRSHRLSYRQVQCHNAVAAVCSLESLRVGARLRIGLPVPSKSVASGGAENGIDEWDTMEHQMKVLRLVLRLQNGVAAVLHVIEHVLSNVAHQVARLEFMVGERTLVPAHLIRDMARPHAPVFDAVERFAPLVDDLDGRGMLLRLGRHKVSLRSVQYHPENVDPRRQILGQVGDLLAVNVVYSDGHPVRFGHLQREVGAALERVRRVLRQRETRNGGVVIDAHIPHHQDGVRIYQGFLPASGEVLDLHTAQLQVCAVASLTRKAEHRGILRV